MKNIARISGSVEKKNSLWGSLEYYAGYVVLVL
jgi:hypothetical protein